MATYGTGAAYDLSSYQIPKKKPEPPVREVPTRKKKRARAITIRMQTVCSFAIVVVLVGLMVLNQVWLTEVSGDINELNSQLQEMESENARMLSELEATVSIRAIGEQAKTELGMNQRTAHQTIYITLEKEDKIELTENTPAPTLGGKVKLALTDIIGSIQEYLQQE